MIHQEADADESELDELPLLRVERKARQPIVVIMRINGQKMPMEVDTEAAVSVILSATNDQLFSNTQLSDTTIILTTYTGGQMAVVGQMELVQVVYGKVNKLLLPYVVKEQGPSLMGREWLKEVQLDWQKLNVASTDLVTQSSSKKVDNCKLLQKYNTVFTEGLGVMNTFEAALQLKEGAKPKFCHARPVPFALKGVIEKELDRLEAEGTLKKVTHSD